MKTCPHCYSTKVILFDADNDLCQDCERWFPAVEDILINYSISTKQDKECANWDLEDKEVTLTKFHDLVIKWRGIASASDRCIQKLSKEDLKILYHEAMADTYRECADGLEKYLGVIK